MALGHEKLDVYRLAINYVAWVFVHSEQLNRVHRHARDQWLRASQSIPLNSAEGKGKTAEGLDFDSDFDFDFDEKKSLHLTRTNRASELGRKAA